MKYFNLLVLFMITLKCGADEEPTTVNYSAVENVTNSEVFSAGSTESKLANISNSGESNGSENAVTNATNDNAVEVQKKEFDLPTPGKLAQQRTRMVRNILGSLMKGLTQLNEPDFNEDAGDNEEPSTVNYSSVEIVTNSEVSNASTTEAPENLFDKWTLLSNISKGTLINVTDVYANNPFKNKEFGKLPILRKLPRHRTRLVTNITGSLMKALAQLNKQDSEEDSEDDEEPTSVNYSIVQNVTNSEIFNASTTEAPENIFDKWTLLPNIGKSAVMNVTDASAINPFKNKEFGKLPIPRKLPRHRTRLVTNITGSLMKMLAQLNKEDSEEDPEDDDEHITVNYSTVENVTNSEVSNASNTEAPDNLFNKWTLLPNISKGTVINAIDASAINPFKNKEFGKLPILRKIPRHEMRLVTNITGSLMKALAQLNKSDSEEDSEDYGEPTTVNYSTVENVTNSEVSNASTTEAPDNFFNKWTLLPNISKGTVINATDAFAINPFKNKEFGKLPILGKVPRHGTRLVTNITGSLIKMLAQLNKQDSEEDPEDDEEPTTVNYSTVENVTNCEVPNASTTEAPDHRVDEWIQLPNISSSSESPASENTLIKATVRNATGPFKKNEFGKLPKPGSLPGELQRGTRIATNIIGSLLKGLVPETDSN